MKSNSQKKRNKGGKFTFGESAIQSDGLVRFPVQASDEYRIASEGRVYLFTGSKSAGSFCVTRRGLLLPSKLGHILTETSSLLNYEAPEGAFIRYKGRVYCRTAITPIGEIRLTEKMLVFFNLKSEMHLRSIRSSDIAFAMGAKGVLLEKAEQFGGKMPMF